MIILKHVSFICCRKQRAWRNRAPKAKSHPITLQTYFSLSHPHPAIIFPGVPIHICILLVSLFFFSESYFWFFFCRGKELLRECQISTTTVCCPCSSFNSLQSTEDFLVKKCYTTRFISCAVFPGQVGKGFVRGLHTLPYFISKEK